ncbi:cdo1 [Symbiodinium sp. CCMP2592]|nr:cdo1 [Symbiodinium sp. CCMP2592]
MADASETWLPDDEEFHLEEGEEGLEGSTGASWIAFLRDDVKVQCAVWLCASAAAARHAAAPCCRGLLELGLGVSSKIPSVIGWAIASLLSLAWLLLDLQMVFTSEQRAMLFPPWSILVFVKQPVAVGSVVIFLGYDGRSYVRRVQAIDETVAPSRLQTVGDLAGAPSDKPLYSADGSADWLEAQAIKGTLLAGPFPISSVLSVALILIVLSPPMAFAFFVTSQPLVTLWFLLLASIGMSFLFGVSFMHDSLGLHQIENPSESDVAVSLHVYSPPFQECRIFPPTGAPPKTAPMVSVFVPEGLQKAAEESKSLSLQDFCGKLSDLRAEEGDGKTHLHPVLDLLVSAEMTDMEWASYASPMHFSEFQPVQHIIHCDDEFSVVISCWSPGQKIPPHTVGRGRVMWLKVLHGNLLFQEYSPGLFPWESDVERQTELGEGSASFLEECGVRMHDVKNLSETEPAVSIQVFSPPLTSFTFHSEKGTERRDLPWLVGQADATKGSEAFSSSSCTQHSCQDKGGWADADN